MTVASELTKLNTNLTNAYTAVSNKGGTLPSAQNMDNLATAISSISSGSSTPVIESLNVTPTTSLQTITAPSGTDGYNPVNIAAVTNSIDSNITAENIKKDITILGVTGNYEGSGGGIGISREVKNSVYQMPTGSFTFSLPSNATNIGNYGLYYAFNGCTSLASVDLSSLTTVSGSYGLASAFYNCTGLTSVDLSSLTTVSGSYSLNYTFRGCTSLASVDLSSLTTVSGSNALAQGFYNCRSLTSVDLSSLTTVSGSNALYSAFMDTCLTGTLDLSSLTTVSGNNALIYAFQGCTGLTDIYFRALTTKSFGSYKNQFNYMMGRTGTSTTHTLHFPSNLQSTISGLTGYPLFSGTSGYVVCAFDLPATS